MKEIPLNTKEKKSETYLKYVALVDDDDYDEVMKYNWNIAKRKKKFYCACRINKKLVLLHRFVMKANHGEILDHKDGDGLNNQKSNLRFCTYSQNNTNRRPHGSSKYLGVCVFINKKIRFIKEINDYKTYYYKYCRSQITVNGTIIYLGTFKCEIEAAKAYDSYAKIYHGEFANLNFKDNT